MSMILSVEKLSKSWNVSSTIWSRRSQNKALDDINFRLHEGEVLGIVGESGCGKSTLARILVGLHSADQGRVLLKGRDLQLWPREARARFMQMVFQDPSAALHSHIRVREQVAEPLRYVLGWNEATVKPYCEDLWRAVRLPPETMERFPHELSGGQKQRVCIARALAMQPTLLICDEPLSSLDRVTQLEVLDVLKSWREAQGGSLILISHDLSVVRHVCHRVMVLHRGRIVELARTDALFASPQHPYTHHLLQSVPRLYRDRDFPGALRGDAEFDRGRAASPTAGCSWASACPFVQQRCFAERPPLRPGPGARGEVACHRLDELPWMQGVDDTVDSVCETAAGV